MFGMKAMQMANALRREIEDAFIEAIEAEIARLTPKAESGSDWADICALENEAADIRRQIAEDN
jgi:hypothetical protein